ncbi:MAG: DUF3016 domain-containing protein [Verrucomicrobiota bacterium JB022]|nr:DUF3016 domain-containing protein [Verrucomicrobiota bacterium JB022]
MKSIITPLLGLLAFTPLAQAQLTVNYLEPDEYRDIAYPTDRDDQKALDAVARELNEKLGTLYEKRFSGENKPKLELTFKEIDLAGEYEWWRVNLSDTRIVKDIYPPRLVIDYKLTDDNGNVLKEGTKKLTDLSFQMTASPRANTEQLYYEKRLLEDFFRYELSKDSVAQN